MNLKVLRPTIACGLFAIGLALGCTTSRRPPSEIYHQGVFRRVPMMKPVVAVMDFENKSGFSGNWNLGNGMADLMNAGLMESSRIIVLERMHLRDVMDELAWQGHQLFRPEGTVEAGRLKHARYLIRGSITDFTVTGDASGWFSTDKVAAKARRSEARVAMAVKVFDVASGEIVSTVKTSGRATSGGFGGVVNYKQVAFGGDVYGRTPLGEATETAIRKAVKQILRELPREPWRARVADVIDGVAYINGGQNVGIMADQTYVVREPPRPITDPSTGNVIEFIPGEKVGQLRVVNVNSTSSEATIQAGRALRGHYLEVID